MQQNEEVNSRGIEMLKFDVHRCIVSGYGPANAQAFRLLVVLAEGWTIWQTGLPHIKNHQERPPSDKELAKLCRCATKTIQNSRKILIEEGWLLAEKNPMTGLYTYQVTVPDDVCMEVFGYTYDLSGSRITDGSEVHSAPENNTPAPESITPTQANNSRGAVKITDPSLYNRSNSDELADGRALARHQRPEGKSHEQSDRASARRDSDDRGRDPRGGDAVDGGDSLSDVRENADHRRGERAGEASRAKDEGSVGYSYEALSFEQRDRLRANIAQVLSDTWQGTAERHATEGAQRLMQFAATMVPPGQIEPLIGVAIGRSSHAHTVKSGVEFAIGHFTRVVTEVQEQSQPRPVRSGRPSRPAARLPQPGSSFEEEDDWSAKYKRAFDLAKEAQQ